MAAKKKAPKAPKAPGTKKRRGVTLQPTGLVATELPLRELADDVKQLADRVAADGGAVIGGYREPLGGHSLLFVALPLEKVEPTPFQRDVSDAHVRKLTVAMDKTRRFLDPIIAVREGDKYMTPNGNHRLTALRELGSKSIVALLVPERKVAYQILALNIEKAHNLRERAMEVMRMYKDLANIGDEKETDYGLEFEEPSLVTLGFAYAERGRLSGGAYNSPLRKVDSWIDKPLAQAQKERERRAGVVLALDDAVSQAVERLKEKGLTSPYLKSFVVARINPLRFIKGEPPPFDELFATMEKRAKGMDASKIRTEDLAKSGGAPDEE
jgi:ParB family transcriptional regulator, chromosome partitioning protein